MVAHRKVQIGINRIEEELIESVGTRGYVAFYLATSTICVQVREYKECNR